METIRSSIYENEIRASSVIAAVSESDMLTLDGDYVKVLGTSVVSTVHHSTHRQSLGDTELVASCSSSPLSG